MRRRAALAGALAGAAIASATAALVLPGSGPAGVEGDAEHAARMLPAPVVPAFRPGAPHGLGSRRDLAYWAPVRRATLARAAPDRTAPVVVAVATKTPEGTDNALAVLARRPDASGTRWVRVRLAALPNGTTGWVPRSALGGYETVHTRLDVDLEQLRATLLRRGRVFLRVPVGVGMPSAPTPRGRFYVRNRLTRYRSPVYGPVAFGTSARSETITDWPAGGFVGIHGTDRPDLIPGRVSHGCIRMRNGDILRLARLMPIGTTVRIF
ncbi:MAG TPA: L,D-transpeptidase [Solirubrobacteraceae bacterium]|jgi:lipoprotein-anchoring transpeptidase ErfK/SrfK|nr:L,D-transpeptidase [Solirubrobacteraceae bacterium]